MKMRFSWAALALFLLIGCESATIPQAAPRVPTVESDQQATCRAAKDPKNPLVVEWPGTAKTALQAASQRGIVVVSYNGCVMKVLSGCNAGGLYQTRRVTPSQERVDIDTEEKLFAELPLGVANLRGFLEQGSRLSLEYVSVGQQVADGEPMSLKGSCEGATHYVRAITIGAYSLDASAGHGVGASVGAGIGVGGESKGKVSHLRGSGDLEGCKANPGSMGCEAVLQVSVEPLPRAPSEPGKVEAGFGRGLGGLSNVPTLAPIPEVAMGKGLRDADTQLLELVQAATRAEKDDGVGAEERRKAWKRVELYKGNHSFKDVARQRSEDWGRMAVADAKRIRKATEVCDRSDKDSAKLQELMKIDDDVVPQRQKAAYQKEYDRAYAPFKEILTECDSWRSKSSAAWVDKVMKREEEAEHERAATSKLMEEQRQKSGQVDYKNAKFKEAVDDWETAHLTRTLAMVGGVALFGAGAVMRVAAEDNNVKNSGLVIAGVGAVVAIVALAWRLPPKPTASGVARSARQLGFGFGPALVF